MPTIKEIREGKECEGCSADCVDFVGEADCCLYQTFISKLYDEVVDDIDGNKSMNYRPDKRKRETIRITIKNWHK